MMRRARRAGVGSARRMIGAKGRRVAKEEERGSEARPPSWRRLEKCTMGSESGGLARRFS